MMKRGDSRARRAQATTRNGLRRVRELRYADPHPRSSTGRIRTAFMSSGTSTRRSALLLAGLSSLAFWVCLFAAAGCYALVVLAPKLCAFCALDAEHESNQWRLVALEHQIARLKSVTEAQQRDPAFIRQQAESDFAVAPADEQRIPVEAHLTLHIGSAQPEPGRRAVSLPPYFSIVWFVSRSREIGDGLLAVAAILVVGAFTIFPAGRTVSPPVEPNL